MEMICIEIGLGSYHQLFLTRASRTAQISHQIPSGIWESLKLRIPLIRELRVV